MDISLQVPELVKSQELRSRINKVSSDNDLTSEHGMSIWNQDSALSVSPDTVAEYPVPAESQGVTAGPPGPQRDDDGLHLAGRRGEHS